MVYFLEQGGRDVYFAASQTDTDAFNTSRKYSLLYDVEELPLDLRRVELSCKSTAVYGTSSIYLRLQFGSLDLDGIYTRRIRVLKPFN